MKTIVIYKTMTGSTQKYAEIISKDLGADLSKLELIRSGSLKNYDMVIFGGSVHMGTISGLKKFKRSIRGNQSTRTIVFAVGASSPDNAKVVGDLVRKNFPEGTQQLKFFYMQGGMDLTKMKQPFRGLMSWVKKMVEMNPDKKPDEVEFLRMFDAGDAVVSGKNTEELVRYARGM